MSNRRIVPVRHCDNCGGTIWREGNWFQCSGCGALSTPFGGIYPNYGSDMKEMPTSEEFVKRVNKAKETLKK